MEQLIAAQQELCGRITRTHENLRKTGASKVSPSLLESAIKLLDKKWAKVEEHHDRLRQEYWTEAKSSDYIKNNVIVQIEDLYLQQRGALLDWERSLVSNMEKVTGPKPSTSDAVHSRGSLPRIELPHFSGRYEDWPTFRDLFSSLIYKDETLPDVEKLHYLKVSVKGDADLLIRNLAVTAENFRRAWDTLSAQYENKRLLVRSYLSSFTAMPKMKSESTAELQRILHGLVNAVGSLEGIGRPIHTNADLLVHLVVELMEARTRREWEHTIGGSTNPPTYDELRRFIERKLHTLEALTCGKPEPSSARSETQGRFARAHHAKSVESNTKRCPLCAKNHYILFCGKYKAQSDKERMDTVLKYYLCVNCLGRHATSTCRSTRTCVHCAQRHHSSVHDACVAGNQATVSCATARSHGARSEQVAVLLATARVKVADRFGTRHDVRALIDSGSETSLITESLVQRLRVPRASAAIAIVGVGGLRTGTARGRVNVTVMSRKGDAVMDVRALVLPRLTAYGDVVRSIGSPWPHLEGLELADPRFAERDRVEMILGVDAFAQIVQEGLRKGRPGEPIAQQTLLGWMVLGAIGAHSANVNVSSSHQCSVEDELSTSVRRFWEQEEVPSGPPPVSLDEQKCLDHYAKTHSRLADGRYIVRIPLATAIPDLYDTRRAAFRMLQAVEERCKRDAELRALYSDFMAEYQELGHMTPAAPLSETTRRPGCFLPHHGVIKESSATTRLRVVFNGSQKTRQGRSLNDCLMVGPNLLPLLADILLR